MKSSTLSKACTISRTPSLSNNGNPPILANLSNFSLVYRYEVHLPEDNAFGKELQNGSWNGMIGMIVDQVEMTPLLFLVITLIID